jgi:uncharacterized protein YndB with AHSA1/START domain
MGCLLDRFTATTDIPVSTKVVFDAWLDNQQHGEMTQSPVIASTEIAGRFTAHDGYINGINLELEPSKRILQTWHKSQFEETDPDPSIEVTLEAVSSGTQLTLRQWTIPDGKAEGYQSGW